MWSRMAVESNSQDLEEGKRGCLRVEKGRRENGGLMNGHGLPLAIYFRSVLRPRWLGAYWGRRRRERED